MLMRLAAICIRFVLVGTDLDCKHSNFWCSIYFVARNLTWSPTILKVADVAELHAHIPEQMNCSD